ncbi:MAG: CvpA family protein [Thermoguttaceae bacterium]
MNIFDIVIGAIVIFLVIRGIYSGMVKQILSLASYLFGWIVAAQGSALLAPMIPVQPPWNMGIAMLLLFVGTLVAFWFVRNIFETFLKILCLHSIDHILGGVVGFVKAVILCAIITFFCVMLSGTTRSLVAKSFSGKLLINAIDRTGALLSKTSHEILKQQIAKFQEQLKQSPADDKLSPNWMQSDKLIPNQETIQNLFSSFTKVVSDANLNSANLNNLNLNNAGLKSANGNSANLNNVNLNSAGLNNAGSDGVNSANSNGESSDSPMTQLFAFLRGGDNEAEPKDVSAGVSSPVRSPTPMPENVVQMGTPSILPESSSQWMPPFANNTEATSHYLMATHSSDVSPMSISNRPQLQESMPEPLSLPKPAFEIPTFEPAQPPGTSSQVMAIPRSTTSFRLNQIPSPEVVPVQTILPGTQSAIPTSAASLFIPSSSW